MTGEPSGNTGEPSEMTAWKLLQGFPPASIASRQQGSPQEPSSGRARQGQENAAGGVKKGTGEHFQGGAESSHRRPVSASINEKIQAFQPQPLETRGLPSAPTHPQGGSPVRRVNILPDGRPSLAQGMGPVLQPMNGRQTGEGFGPTGGEGYGRTEGEGFSDDVGHLHAQRLSQLDAALPSDAGGGSTRPRSSFPGFPTTQGFREANGKVDAFTIR
jgi:hypothetical protein